MSFSYKRFGKVSRSFELVALMTYFQIHTLDYMVKIQCKGGKNTSNMRLIEGKNTIYDKYSINCLAGA